MPAKKKGTADDSQQVAMARQSTAAGEAERLHREELALRERIQQEEEKVLESQYVRAMEIQKAIEERERQAQLEIQEREVKKRVARIDATLMDLRSKLIQQHGAQVKMGTERELAARRIAMLTSELELAQTKLLEAESRADAKGDASKEAYRALEDKYDALQNELRTITEERDAFREMHGKSHEAQCESPPTPEATVDAAELDQAASPAMYFEGTDAEAAALFRVLRAEVEQYKELAADLQSAVDQKSSDEKKSSLLMGILNTQLDTIREENKRLYDTSQTKIQEAQAATNLLTEERERRRVQLKEMERLSSEAAVQEHRLQLEIGVHKSQVDALTARRKQLEEEHSALVTEHSRLQQFSNERQRAGLEENMALKSELERLRLELAQSGKDKQQADDDAFTYKVLTRAEMDSLKTRLRKLQEASQRKEQEAYETITVLRAQVDTMERTHRIEQQTAADDKKRLEDELQKLSECRNGLQTDLAETTRRLEEREKNLYEELLHMTARHDSKHDELLRLQALLQERDREYTNNTVFLTAEKEGFRMRLESLEQELHQRRQEHLQQVERITKELATLQRHLHDEEARQASANNVESSRAAMAERNVARLQQHIRVLDDQIKTTALKHDDVVRTLKDDARELRSELCVAKRTIDRLESVVGDQAGYHQLIDLNDKLSRDLKDQVSKVASLSNALETMKEEQDIMGAFKISKLTEANEQLTRRLHAAELGRKQLAPLLGELRAAATRGQLSGRLSSLLDQLDLELLFPTLEPQPHVPTGNENAVERVVASEAAGLADASPRATVAAAVHPVEQSPAPDSTAKNKGYALTGLRMTPKKLAGAEGISYRSAPISS